MEGFIQSAPWVLGLIVVIAVLLVATLYMRSRYKTAKANEALVITGGKNSPKILPAGGAFVSPLRQVQYFPLDIISVSSGGQATQTSTHVQVVVEYAAKVRVSADPDMMRVAVKDWSGHAPEQIRNALRDTLDAAVRTVVAGMDPVSLVRDKDGFNKNVLDIAKKSMDEMGYELINLLIAEITDNDGYYDNLAAKDREETRRQAADLKAGADKDIAVAQADADKAATTAQADRDLVIAGKTRDVEISKLSNKAETDQAQAEADVARAQHDRNTAIARREVEVTEAQTKQQTAEIEAEAAKRKAEIEADAAAGVAEREAEAKAKAEVIRAQGEADAINRSTEAKTKQIEETGLAQAKVSRAQGEAEAASILAKGQAEAEVDRLKASALAANDGVNLQVTLAEIQRDAQVTIHTELGKIMANIGEKATFIDMGGSSGGGSLISNVMGDLMGALKKLDVQSEALNGTSFGGSLGALINQASGKSGSDNGTPQQIDPTVETPAPAEPTTPAMDVVAVTTSGTSPDSIPESKTPDAK